MPPPYAIWYYSHVCAVLLHTEIIHMMVMQDYYIPKHPKSPIFGGIYLGSGVADTVSRVAGNRLLFFLALSVLEGIICMCY